MLCNVNRGKESYMFVYRFVGCDSSTTWGKRESIAQYADGLSPQPLIVLHWLNNKV